MERCIKIPLETFLGEEQNGQQNTSIERKSPRAPLLNKMRKSTIPKIDKRRLRNPARGRNPGLCLCSYPVAKLEDSSSGSPSHYLRWCPCLRFPSTALLPKFLVVVMTTIANETNVSLAPKKATRARSTVSCLPCKRRKQRCDRTTPCSNCISRRAELDCVYEPPK
jgi:hypothetical protein